MTFLILPTILLYDMPFFILLKQIAIEKDKNNTAKNLTW